MSRLATPRNVPRLQSSGQEVIAPPLTSRSEASDSKGGASKTEKSANQRRGEPQTARSLLEENKQLVLRKKEDNAMARKKSREFIDGLLEGDQKIMDADKAKNASRRLAQQELSKYYKSRIAEKESEKQNAYTSRREAGVGETYFPYVEGEHINQTRKSQNALMREEMRVFLQDQRDTKPAKSGRLMNGDSNYDNLYSETCRSGMSQEPRSSDSQGVGGKQPKFLTRPTEHMSRRVKDDHVRRALERQVETTKNELEQLANERQMEAQAWEEGMLVNDALRYDATQSKSADFVKNAEFLRLQIEERKIKNQRDKDEKRQEVGGYYGPEEKQIPGMIPQLLQSADLIRQMEVNQNRRLASRQRRIVQERRLVDNSIADIHQERDIERQKLQLHREVLVTTWDSQRKMKEVANRIELELQA